MKTLIIAEKPSVARDIASALGGDFAKQGTQGSEYFERDDIVISSAIGHLVGLQCPESEDPGYNLQRLPVIPSKFALAALPKTEGQLKLLNRLMSRPDVDLVVNACDAGREGELIFRYIYLYCGCRKAMSRMWLQSMTPASIMGAFADMRPGQELDPLFYAAQSRSEADWLVGINGSRAVSILYEMKMGRKGKNSVGRVQTPVLNIIVEREEAIRNFVAKDYFEVLARFSDGSRKYTAKWIDPAYRADPLNPDHKADRFFDRSKADAIVTKCSGHMPSSVVDVANEIVTPPPKLFDLTTLQREANKKFGFSASDTLKLAQALYEKHKVLTYPRTDANALPEDYLETTQTILTRLGQSQLPLAQYALAAVSEVRPDKRIFNNEKISDHFAIIPNGQISSSLSNEEACIYDLVLRRFIAAFHRASRHLQTVRTTLLNGETFRSSGRILAAEGWLAIYGRDVEEEEEPALCTLNPGERLPTAGIAVEKQKTKRPARFTEAMLLGAMETAGAIIDDEELREAMKGRGLGTPATRAAIIEKLLDPEVAYLTREKKLLIPTQKGFDLIQFLRENNLTALTAAKTTGEWEFKFKQMEQNKYPRQTFMAEIQRMSQDIVERVKTCAQNLPPSLQSSQAEASIQVPCPRCQGNLTSDARTISCECGFKVWREIGGLRLSDDQWNTLLSTRELPTTSGFISTRTKKPYSAGLKFSTDFSKVDFVFEERTSGTPGGSPSSAKSTKGPSTTRKSKW
jgi:DNA topoisomerase-3